MGPIATGLGEIFLYTVHADAGARQANGTALRRHGAAHAAGLGHPPAAAAGAGVTEVNTIGGYEKQFHVTPDPARLLAFGLTFDDIVEALREQQHQHGRGLHRAQRRAVPDSLAGPGRGYRRASSGSSSPTATACP